MKRNLFLLFTISILLGAAGFVLAENCGTDSPCVTPQICVTAGTSRGCATQLATNQCIPACPLTQICFQFANIVSPFGPCATPFPAGNASSSSGSGSSSELTLPNPLCPSSTIPNPNPPPATIPNPNCIQDFPGLISRITSYILTLIAGLAVIMFLWAGILFVTSAGNEGRLGNAKKALWWAVVGIAIAIAGQGLIAVITAVLGNPT